MPVTINDVAREAGVSAMTVSRALRDDPLVAAQTRQRILDVAQALDYAPNLLARSLAQQRSPIIGLIVTELANPFFTPIISAIQEEVRRHHYFVMIGDSERHISNQDTHIDQFQQMQIGGLFITPLTPDMTALERVRDRGIPVVAIARRWPQGDFVSVDNYATGRMVAEHLIATGHRRVGCVYLSEAGHTAVSERVAGFVETLRESGIRPPAKWMIKTKTLRVEEGIQVADAFLALSPRPTAVFVISDRLAIGFVDRLIHHGVWVPDDVAIVGFDDIRFSAFLKVPLTTVALPKAEIGRKAAEILFARLEQPNGAGDWRQVLLQPELIVRASTVRVV